jgi:imidazolonepropionase
MRADRWSCRALSTRTPTWYGPATGRTSLRCAWRARATWRSWQPAAGLFRPCAPRARPAPEDLLAETRARAQGLFKHGVTTAEAKTGYGLETQAELRQMAALLALDEEGPLEIVPTFLGAHAIPANTNRPGGLHAPGVEEMLPETRAWWHARGGNRPLPFVDVFCETGAFTLEQSRRILSSAQRLGFPLKIHADEFDNLGGASLAAELGRRIGRPPGEQTH